MITFNISEIHIDMIFNNTEPTAFAFNAPLRVSFSYHSMLYFYEMCIEDASMKIFFSYPRDIFHVLVHKVKFIS